MNNPDLIHSGASVKALGGGKVGGYLVLFSTKDSPDIAGDFFTKDTDFDLERASFKTSVYYHHGLDAEVGKKKIGDVASMEVKDSGVWVETQLNLRDEYEAAIYGMAKAGKLGWSSGTASHLVERETEGKSHWIKQWPLGLDASLTPTPCEPRIEALPIKSLPAGPSFAEMKSGLTTSDERFELCQAIMAACDSDFGYLEDYDDDTAYWSGYVDDSYGLWAVPYSRKRGALTVGDPTPCRARTVYETISSTKTARGLKFVEHSQEALETLKGFGARAADYADMKAERGRPLSDEARTAIKTVRDKCDEVLASSRPSLKTDAQKLLTQLDLSASEVSVAF